MMASLEMYFHFLFLLFLVDFCQNRQPGGLDTLQLIRDFGYPAEKHTVETEDGFLLTVFRIPHGNAGKGVNERPIIMMHGLFGSAENYIVNGVNNGSLALNMADNGYDVWIGNARGSFNSLKHKNLKPEQKEFWDFSWHEIGLYDLSAKIDYILEKTKKKKVHYVGHSQGGLFFYVLCTMRPEYQEKIALASMLAPAGFQKHFPSLYLRAIVPRHRELTQLAETLNIHQIPPYWMEIDLEDIALHGCKNTLFRLRDICELIYHLSVGGNSHEYTEDTLILSAKFIPSVSTKQLLHFAQTIASGHLCPWDYGEEVNLKVYGKKKPDDYPVETIKTPVAYYYGLHDIMVGYKDVDKICETIPNCVRKYMMPNRMWSHFDFVIAKHAAQELNTPLIRFADKYGVD